MNLLYRILTIAVLAASLASTGCLFRSHTVPPEVSSVPLQSATQTQLVDKLNAISGAIHTVNAAVDISTTVGGAKKGVVTEYSEITGYILAEKPSMLRMIGQFPIVKNRAFDMVSDAQGFELWIPTKNRFIIGPNEVTKPSPNPLENLRPQIILDALLFHSLQPDEIAVLEARVQEVPEQNSKRRVTRPNYVLDVIQKNQSSGQWYLARKVYFDRADLLPYRQLLFNDKGEVATDAHYSSFKDFQKIPFPTYILIHRPQEEYTIGLKFTKLTLNAPFKPDQFKLPMPSGAEVIRLDAGSGQGSASATRSAEELR
jgi:outer membrane lipoprotein-sorting protein